MKIDSFEDKKITKGEGCVQRRFLNVKTVKLNHHSFESRVTAARVKLSGSQKIMQSLQHKDQRVEVPSYGVCISIFHFRINYMTWGDLVNAVTANVLVGPGSTMVFQGRLCELKCHLTIVFHQYVYIIKKIKSKSTCI